MGRAHPVAIKGVKNLYSGSPLGLARPLLDLAILSPVILIITKLQVKNLILPSAQIHQREISSGKSLQRQMNHPLPEWLVRRAGGTGKNAFMLQEGEGKMSEQPNISQQL